jgi:hypothetical protein
MGAGSMNHGQGMLGGLLGAPSNKPSGLQNMYGQGYNLAHINNQQGLGQSQAAQQAQLLRHQFNQALQPKEWMIAGRAMDLNEFANEMFGEDTPEKTFFILKYSKGNENDN